jgi:hypothetical protein
MSLLLTKIFKLYRYLPSLGDAIRSKTIDDEWISSAGISVIPTSSLILDVDVPRHQGSVLKTRLHQFALEDIHRVRHC